MFIIKKENNVHMKKISFAKILTYFSIPSVLALVILNNSFFSSAQELILYSKDVEEIYPNTIILDSLDLGGDKVIQFGSSLNEQLFWDSANTQFVFTDDLNVQGNINQEGNTFTLDSENIGAGANVEIVANQGSDSDGILRYNATTNEWELSNNGGGFESIASLADIATQTLPTVQARRTGGYTLTSATFADITFNTTDIETDSTIIEHDNALTDNINISEDGLYLITYNLNLSQGTANIDYVSRVRANDTTVLNGSISENSNYQGEYTASNVTFFAELNDGDFVTLQAQRLSPNNMNAETDPLFTVTKMDGIKGEKGDQGDQGLPGSVGAGTNSEIFTIDQDNTGGNLTLRFGTSLSEALSWDATNSEFDFSDNLDINETGQAIEVGNGTASDVFINFDDGTDRTFGWDDSQNSFSTFNTPLDFMNYQSANPPAACAPGITGKQWMDSDTGIVYVCDTSNGRNKWLSINEQSIWGDESGSCGIGDDAGSAEGCNVDWGNGLGPDSSTDLGFYIPQPITVVGYAFSADNDACTIGSFDVEIFGTNSNTNDNSFSLQSTIASGLNDETHNSYSLNSDINGNQYILWGIDNNCLSTIDDWNVVLYYRYRHP